MKKDWREDATVEQLIKKRDTAQNYMYLCVVGYFLSLIGYFCAFYYLSFLQYLVVAPFISMTIALFVMFLVGFIVHRCNIQLFIYLKRVDE